MLTSSMSTRPSDDQNVSSTRHEPPSHHENQEQQTRLSEAVVIYIINLVGWNVMDEYIAD